MEASPAWLQTFLDRLAADDLSAATCRGYRYDLLQFIAWYTDLNNAPPEIARMTEHDLITWRQHMMTRGGLKAASINRRLEAIRRLLRWAEAMAPWHAMSRSTSSRCVSSANAGRSA